MTALAKRIASKWYPDGSAHHEALANDIDFAIAPWIAADKAAISAWQAGQGGANEIAALRDILRSVEDGNQ